MNLNEEQLKEVFAADSISVEDVERINKIIMNVGGVDKEDIIPKADLTNDLGFYSLELCELIMNLEEEFQIPIPNYEARNIHFVSDIYSVVAKRLADKK